MASTPEYASDGTTLVEVINNFASQGYDGEFITIEGGRVRCKACGNETPAGDLQVEAMRRTEGASDPGDMAFIAAMTCPNCQAKGIATLRYGPEAPLEDADVLKALEDIRPGQE